jgi:hypothetical protein
MKSLLVIFFFSVFGSHLIHAQANLSDINRFKAKLYLGASMPIDDFAAVSGKEAGYSKTGFCFMLEGTKPISPIIDWSGSVALSVNGMDVEEMENQMPPLDITAGNYVTTWIMTGLLFGPEAVNDTRIYLSGHLGILFSSFPDITIEYEGSSATQTTSMGTAIAFGFGAGIQLQKINFGVRYFSATPSYTMKADGYHGSESASLPASVVLLMIGITF